MASLKAFLLFSFIIIGSSLSAQSFTSNDAALSTISVQSQVLNAELNSLNPNSPTYAQDIAWINLKKNTLSIISSILTGEANATVENSVVRSLAQNDVKPIDGNSYDFENEVFAKQSTADLNTYLLGLLKN